jgi:6-phosphogluconolactonase (cycloisomerase 2 family)
MKYAKSFALLVFAASLLMLVACSQKSNCNGISFGTGGSGSGSGGVSSGGSVCGGSNGGGGVRDFLFFQQSGNILNTASFDGAKMTASVGNLVPSLGAGAGADMVVVNKAYLYLTWVPAGGSGGQVLGFSINHTNGALTPLSGSPFPTGTSKVDTIVADPQGRYLVVGNSSNGDLSVLAINSTTGALSLTASSPFTNSGLVPTQLVLDGTGNYLYITQVSHTGSVSAFAVDQATFDLSELAASPFFLLVTKVAAEPSGQYLLAVDGSSNVDVISIEQGTGNLGNLVPYPGTHGGDSLIVSPNGKFVYAYSIGNHLEGFSFSGGTLTPLTGSPFTQVEILHPEKIDQTGTAIFGYTVTGGFGVYTVNSSTGAVTGGLPDLSVTSSPNFAPTN